MSKRKRKGAGVGHSIGSILVGFDQAVFRTLPPAEELVHHARPDDPLPAGAGGEYLIQMPEVIPIQPPTNRKRRRAPITGE